MAQHFVITFRVSPGAQPESIGIKAPTEAAALARLAQIAQQHGKPDMVVDGTPSPRVENTRAR